MPCPLAWFAYWPLLTASLASFIAAGLTDVDRGPLGSGRPFDGWKYWYNAIVLSPLPVQNLTVLKFFTLKFHTLYFCIARLHAKYTKICTIQKSPAIRYCTVNFHRWLYLDDMPTSEFATPLAHIVESQQRSG